MANGSEATPKSEQLNSMTRSLVVLFLVTAFTVGFISVIWTGKVVVSTDAFSLVLGVAMTWLFASRDKQQQAEEVKDAVQTMTGSASVAVAKAEERAKVAEEKAAAPAPTPTPAAMLDAKAAELVKGEKT